VVKAYTTRVGNGPLPTGFDPEMDEHVRRLGGEFGATTGRPRRCGWFDAVLARYAARVNGLTGLAVTKLDVLDTLPEMAIATAYRTPRGRGEGVPGGHWSRWRGGAGVRDHARVADLHGGGPEPLRPAYRTPAAYLDRIEELTGAPIRMVSVGTRRDQIIHAA
jgi:adenylosuccinate synthase